MEFHQTLQTHSYLQRKPKSLGPMLLELFPFVILKNAMAFVYAYIQCLDGPVSWFSLTFCDLIQVFYY